MGLDNVLHDAEAQARAATSPASSLVHPVEPLEQPWKVLLGNADSGVSDIESNKFALVLQTKIDAAFVGVLQRVLDEVYNHLGHLRGVRLDIDVVGSLVG